MRINATIPIWHKDIGQWIYRPSIDGVQKKYTSRREGKTGYNECIKKHNAAIGAGDPSKVRFERAWEEFLADKKKRLGEGSVSYVKAKSIGKTHLMPTMKLKMVCKITSQDWQDILNDAKPTRGGTKVMARKSLSSIRSEIMAFAKFCKKKQYIAAKWEDLEIPRDRPTLDRNKVVLQLEVLKNFLHDNSLVWYLHAWQLMVTTGLRPGEIYGLQRGDINGEVLTVRRAINNQKRVTTGKNENALRTFMLRPIDLHILKLQMDMLNKAGVISPWLFCDEYGAMPNPIIIGNRWEEYRKCFPEKVTQYGLRHTFVSHMKTVLPEALLKSLVGHSATMDTLGVYGQKITEDDRLAAKLVGAYFDSVMGEY